MKTSIAALAALTLAGVACGSSAPSRELRSARDAYSRARTSDAASYAPDSLMGARQALDAAERAHADDPRSAKEKSYAYVAERRSDLAMVQGNIGRQRREQEQAKLEYSKLQDQLRTESQKELHATKDRAASLNNQLQRQTQQTATAVSDKERERRARLEAEARAQHALESLEQIAQVKEEARGTVITLSGQVLFVTGKADLLPAARDRLADVAKALVDNGEDRLITVEGHTDSRGNEDANLTLSTERAQAVRDYLVSLGVKPERISAIGRGEAQPIASNDTAEGRANNRRVEIILGQRTGTSAQTPNTR
ncbi:MAG TPA: OmpA family protein [Polyangiaceae bacterium]|jgi:outer membrane protein OmpA-like peptidoglycan-associated protein|nr:OmpA family protein [Polyangiaceae bacterium]